MRSWLVGTVALAACGRLHFDERGDSGSTMPADAFVAFPPGTSYQPATVVGAFANPAEDDDPTVTGDGVELYFASKRTGNGDIYRATRPDRDAAWLAPMLVTELSTGSAEEQPGIALDGLTIWFSSGRAPSLGAEDIWVATRTMRGQQWSAPIHLVELSSSGEDLGAQPNSDLLRIVLYRYTGSNAPDLYEATRGTTAAMWGAPALITELDTTFENMSPQLVTDRELVFVSDRTGTTGGRDIWLAPRSSTASPFTMPAMIAGLNSTALDDDPWVSPDGTYILFASERGGNREIYEARRAP